MTIRKQRIEDKQISITRWYSSKFATGTPIFAAGAPPLVSGAPLTVTVAIVVRKPVAAGTEALVSDGQVPAAVTAAAVVLGALVDLAEGALV